MKGYTICVSGSNLSRYELGNLVNIYIDFTTLFFSLCFRYTDLLLLTSAAAVEEPRDSNSHLNIIGSRPPDNNYFEVNYIQRMPKVLASVFCCPLPPKCPARYRANFYRLVKLDNSCALRRCLGENNTTGTRPRVAQGTRRRNGLSSTCSSL